MEPLRFSFSGDYVQYLEGNIPLVITVPHGGTLRPDDIPDRTTGVMDEDWWTIDLAHDILLQWSKQEPECSFYGLPHVVICLLNRTKIDANRSRGAATEPPPLNGPLNPADGVWVAYHDRIAAAARAALSSHGRVLIADLHGQSHRAASELGYLLTTDDLQLTDEQLDADPVLASKCSLGALTRPANSAVSDAGSLPSLSNIVRGPLSLGALIASRWDGAACVPSPSHPRPHPGETYFWGAYTCAAHSRGLGWATGATMDEDRAVGAAHDAALRRSAAVQIEVPLVPFI